MNHCEACGGNTINHPLHYFGTFLDLVLQRFRTVLPTPKGSGKAARLAALAWEALVSAGLSERLEAPDEKTLGHVRTLWEEAARRGIIMREYRPFSSVRNSFTARLPDGTILDFDGMPDLPGRELWWFNNKSVFKRRFRTLGLPVPHGGAAATASRARELFERLQKPVVVKPVLGSASRHTTMHVRTEPELLEAFAEARRICPLVSIEEELPGDVYRPTLVGGKLIATLRRDQPFICGDGAKSVLRLVEEANEHPARRGPHFSPIELKEAAKSELAYQGLTLESVAQKGRKVKLHQKINWALGGTTEDVTEAVHSENRVLFERVAAALEAPLVGIDFITEDISRPWHETRSGIIECNDMPYFDNHHLPFSGKPRDIAGPLWDLIVASYV